MSTKNSLKMCHLGFFIWSEDLKTEYFEMKIFITASYISNRYKGCNSICVEVVGTCKVANVFMALDHNQWSWFCTGFVVLCNIMIHLLMVYRKQSQLKSLSQLIALPSIYIIKIALSFLPSFCLFVRIPLAPTVLVQSAWNLAWTLLGTLRVTWGR